MKIPKGLEIPGLVKVGYAAKPEGRVRKIPHGLGGEIWRHPCLFKA